MEKVPARTKGENELISSRRVRCALAASVFPLLAACALAPIVSPGPAHGETQPSVTSEDLMYASGADGREIYVFSYPGGNLVDTVAAPKGTIALQGLCSDASGNVFVTNIAPPKNGIGQGHVYEYAHGGTKILKTITFNNAIPFGCSVDPASGTLAVSTVGLDNRGGGLETFTKQGYEKSYYSYNIGNFYYCAYDGQGNLFVNGQGSRTQMYLNELPEGKSGLEDISLNKYVSVSGMGQLQWDGHNLTLEDLTANAIYRLSFSGSSGKVVGTTHINGWNGAALSTIDGSSVLVPVGVSGAAIGFWKYPAGGNAVKTISSPSGLFAVTISVAKQ
jgi:hypothetical protein